ncbi:MAG TPA: hypothetical protein VKW06_02695 [Candidatus Angelobacter sp.]|nr:hypothetical protein [Candidatus Angelobacter sp.]
MEKIKALIGVLVIASGFYVAWNMIPPYFHNGQFQEELDDIVRRATYTAINDDDLKQRVVEKAKSMDIFIKDDQVTVTHTGMGLGISVKYRVHLDMLVHPTDLDFTANSLNKRI